MVSISPKGTIWQRCPPAKRKDTQGSGQTGHTAVWVRVGLTAPGQTAQERKGPSQSVQSRCGHEKQKWAAGLSHGPRKVLC